MAYQDPQQSFDPAIIENIIRSRQQVGGQTNFSIRPPVAEMQEIQRMLGGPGPMPEEEQEEQQQVDPAANANQVLMQQASQVSSKPQPGQGQGTDRIAELLRMAGLDGSDKKEQQQPLSPREQRMQMLRDFMGGTLFNISQGLTAYSKAPAGARNQAMMGASLGGGEVRRQQAETERMEREKLESLERQRKSQGIYDVMRAQNSSDLLPYDIGTRISRVESQLGQANNSNASAENQRAQAQRNRYINVPGRGLFNVQTQTIMPGTSETQITVTPELAATFGLPAQFGSSGIRLSVEEINDTVEALNKPFRMAVTDENVLMVHPLTGEQIPLGPPPKRAAGSSGTFQRFLVMDANGQPGEVAWINPTSGQVVRASALGFNPGTLALMPTVAVNPLVAQLSASGDARAILGQIDQLSAKLIGQVDGAEALGEGARRRAASLINMAPDLVTYEGLISTFTPLMARAVGHNGVLTQIDVDSVKEIFPKNTDDTKTRNAKILLVTDVMNGRIDRMMEMLKGSYGGPAYATLVKIFYTQGGVLGMQQDGTLFGAPGEVGQPATSPAPLPGQGTLPRGTQVPLPTDRQPNPVQSPGIVQPPAQPAPAQPLPPAVIRRGGVIQRVNPPQ